MGRTVPTYRMLLEQVIKRWDGFRRALRRKDREVFDGMMNKARLHSSASIFNIRIDPTESMFMSIILEQEKEIARLKGHGKSAGELKGPPDTQRRFVSRPNGGKVQSARSSGEKELEGNGEEVEG